MSCNRRTSEVIIRRQLWPPPPPDARPYWWGVHDLSFHDGDGNEVWHRIIPEAEGSVPSARVEREERWGWILVLTYTHRTARRMLAAHGLSPRPGRVDRPYDWQVEHDFGSFMKVTEGQ